MFFIVSESGQFVLGTCAFRDSMGCWHPSRQERVSLPAGQPRGRCSVNSSRQSDVDVPKGSQWFPPKAPGMVANNFKCLCCILDERFRHGGAEILAQRFAGNSRNGRQYFKWSVLASMLKVDMDMLKSSHCVLLETTGTVVSISSGMQCWPLG